MFKLLVVLFVCVTIQGCPEIKTREQWSARNPISKLDISEDLPYVIIHHTATSSKCKTQADCENIVRAIQKYHMDNNKWEDIGYSFLIDPFGTIYEARGWCIHGAHSPKFNGNSVGISVIGMYTVDEPSEMAVEAVKNLITCGVETGKIARDYKLLGHRQTRATECPGKAFYEMIKKWPHWASQP